MVVPRAEASLPPTTALSPLAPTGSATSARAPSSTVRTADNSLSTRVASWTLRILILAMRQGSKLYGLPVSKGMKHSYATFTSNAVAVPS